MEDEELGFAVGGGTAVSESARGVFPGGVMTGATSPSGVEACSVANKSGDEEGAERPKLHARINNSAAVVHINLFLVLIQFD